MASVACFKCQTIIPVLNKVGIREECFKCKSDLHVCKTCNHFDPSAYNQCREPQADVVLEKERANYCDYYSPNPNPGGAAAVRDNLMSAAEALFKKKPDSEN